MNGDETECPSVSELPGTHHIPGGNGDPQCMILYLAAQAGNPEAEQLVETYCTGGGTGFAPDPGGGGDPAPAPAATDLSKRGLDCIKELRGFETQRVQGCCWKQYHQYGHLSSPVRILVAITEQEAADLLQQDASWAIQAVRDLVTVDLTQGQFDALVSFTFNVGRARFARSSLLSNLNAGVEVTEGNFTSYNRAGRRVIPGLTARRRDEYTLFSTGNSTRCPD